MPAADIEINAVNTTGTDVAINVAVQLSNADVGGEITYAWTILDQPEGGAVALSNPAIENPTFTPTLEGSYFLRLVVNAATGTERIAYAVVGVVQSRSNLRIPAAGEALEHDTVDGWKTATARWHQLADRQEGGIVIAAAGVGVAVGSIVRLDSATRLLLTGLPGESRVPEATLATATTAALVSGPLGVVIATCSGSPIAAGAAVKVRVRGLVENTEAGAPTVGDFVLVDNLGEPSLLYTATVPVIVGRVVFVGGGVYRWVVEPAVRLERRVTTPIDAAILDASGSWAIGGPGTAALYYVSVVGSASGLHYPLGVNVGEVLYRLEADVAVANVANLVTAYLTKVQGLGGAGVQAAVATSPATIGFLTWNVVPGVGLVLPQELPAGFAFYLYVSTNAGGNARAIGNVTAFVRPA